VTDALDERFAEWVDGEMSERQRERFEAEMRVNAELRARAEAYRRTVDQVRLALRAQRSKVDVADRGLERIASGASGERFGDGAAATSRGPLYRVSRRAMFLSGAVAAGVLATFALLNDWPRTPTGEAIASLEQDAASAAGAEAAGKSKADRQASLRLAGAGEPTNELREAAPGDGLGQAQLPATVAATEQPDGQGGSGQPGGDAEGGKSRAFSGRAGAEREASGAGDPGQLAELHDKSAPPSDRDALGVREAVDPAQLLLKRMLAGTESYRASTVPTLRFRPQSGSTVRQPQLPAHEYGLAAEQRQRSRGRPASPKAGPRKSGLKETGVPETGVPVTGASATDPPAAGLPATGAPATGGPATGAPATGGPATGAPATGGLATGEPATGEPEMADPERWGDDQAETGGDGAAASGRAALMSVWSIADQDVGPSIRVSELTADPGIVAGRVGRAGEEAESIERPGRAGQDPAESLVSQRRRQALGITGGTIGDADRAWVVEGEAADVQQFLLRLAAGARSRGYSMVNGEVPEELVGVLTMAVEPGPIMLGGAVEVVEERRVSEDPETSRRGNRSGAGAPGSAGPPTPGATGTRSGGPATAGPVGPAAPVAKVTGTGGIVTGSSTASPRSPGPVQRSASGDQGPPRLRVVIVIEEAPAATGGEAAEGRRGR